MKSTLMICICIVAIACVQTPPKDTVTLCDENGCVHRPRDYSGYDPSKAFPDGDPDGRIAELKRLGEQDARAAYDLGLRFFRGDGIPQDSYQSLTWMRKAAEGGDLEAQKALGRLYLTGLEEMGSDPREAEKWLAIAADRGDKASGKLLAQARAAKKEDEAYWRWRNHWRHVFYGYWHSGYTYRSYWHDGYWRFHN
jgi:TPR repeat protein